MSRRRDRNSRHSRQRDRDKLLWSTRRFRVGTLTGPAYVEFNFPTEGGGLSRLCVPNSDLRHMNALLDQFSDLLPIFPGDVPSTDGGHKQFIQALVVANDVPLELVPTRPGFIDQNTFATHGEIIYADGTRVARPRPVISGLADPETQAVVDVSGTPEGARELVLKLARYSTYLAFAIGVELAACLPNYMKFRPHAKGEILVPVSETAVFNFSGRAARGSHPPVWLL